MPEIAPRTPPKATDAAIALIERFRPEMAKVIPRTMSAERMVRVCLTALRKTPKLLDCSHQSLMAAMMSAAEMGLEPTGVLGMGYLIPYGKEATFVPGYRGLLSLAYRTGEILSVTCEVVRKKDEFRFANGIEQELRHVPTEDPDTGDMTHAYAILRLKGGGYIVTVMNRRQIEAIQRSSRSGSSGPWQTHPEEMWKKTVLKRALKLAPVCIEVAQAIDADDAAENGYRAHGPILDVVPVVSAQEPQEPPSGTLEGLPADEPMPQFAVQPMTDESRKAARSRLALTLKACGVNTDDLRSQWLYEVHGEEKGLTGCSDEVLRKIEGMLDTKAGKDAVSSWATNARRMGE